MRFADYQKEEIKPALGCTEPASIAFAAASASNLSTGEIKSARLVCDPRIYKNCYAVGIPHSGHKVGIKWALAIGCLLPDPSLKLECFKQIDDSILEAAGKLIDAGRIHVEVDPSRQELFVDCEIERDDTVRAVVEQYHTRLARLFKNGTPVEIEVEAASTTPTSIRENLAALPFDDLISLARSISDDERSELRAGSDLNMAIANHGLSLFPQRFVDMAQADPLTRISRLVCAGVYARMWGEDFVVTAVAGSGNKGIVCSIPLVLFGNEIKADAKLIDESLALACLVTSSTTHHLGTLSAVCGCSNAAGIGLSAGLVLLQGGGPEEISKAVNNMVGNVTGMICDGAKIGCALKTMTSVDAAFRSASLALSGIGIPYSDGIVGEDGMASLKNLGQIATTGMAQTDEEILKIMQEKLR
jgi:L-cysteine desulfidase